MGLTCTQSCKPYSHKQFRFTVTSAVCSNRVIFINKMISFVRRYRCHHIRVDDIIIKNHSGCLPGTPLNLAFGLTSPSYYCFMQAGLTAMAAACLGRQPAVINWLVLSGGVDAVARADGEYWLMCTFWI